MVIAKENNLESTHNQAVSMSELFASTEEAHEESSGIASLGLDVGFFVAQVINFFLLLFILRLFLYRPVLKVLNDRKKTIEESLKLAEETNIRAEATSIEAKEILNQARAEANEIIKSAKESASKVAEEIQVRANQDADGLVNKTRDLLRQERDMIVKSVEKEMTLMLSASLEKVLIHKKVEYSNEELITALSESKENK